MVRAAFIKKKASSGVEPKERFARVDCARGARI